MITSFSGMYRFLSNFWPCVVEYEGEDYPSVEHAYQAAKTTDIIMRKRIREARTPGIAKRVGGVVELRSGWEEIKTVVMLVLLRKKFDNPGLANKLVATGDQYLIEGNTWGDTFWGAIERDGVWVGSNNLGILLMVVRDDIKRE